MQLKRSSAHPRLPVELVVLIRRDREFRLRQVVPLHPLQLALQRSVTHRAAPAHRRQLLQSAPGPLARHQPHQHQRHRHRHARRDRD
ncbi:uncharacterized protein ACA1_102330, partial [Acanthamoeba castellanii str. Neff]